MNENSMQMEDFAEPSDSTNRCGINHPEDELALKVGKLCLWWIKLWLPFIGFMIVAAIVVPPDVISQMVMVAAMAIVYGFTTLVVSRYNLLADTPPRRKTILIFLFSVALAMFLLLGL